VDPSIAARTIVGRRTLADLLDHRAEADARKTFLIFEDADRSRSSWTYAKFNATVNKTANGLTQLGVRKGDRVNVHMTNRPEFLFFWFALARMGGVMVPTNPLSPPDELAYPVSHSEAVLTVTIPALLANVQAMRGQCPAVRQVILCGADGPEPGVLTFEALTDGQSEQAPEADVESLDDAAILYTSGTTARPKGVQVTQANYVFLGEQVSKNVGLRPDDRWLITLPLFHGNAQYYSVMTALTVGASIAVMERFSASRLMQQAADHRATVHSSLATPLRMVMAQTPQPSDGRSGLRLVIFAQSLTPELHEEWDRRYGVPMLQIFGMTETMGQPMVNPLNYRRDPLSIGFPAVGYECRVVDDNGDDMPVGEAGQLIVRGIPGVTIMKGYYRDPSNTSLALRDGWLWTKDVVEIGEDGYFRFLDRAGDLIRRSGENVSAGEVEAVIKSHPAVADAAVVGVPDAMYDEAIKAYVILSDGASATEVEIIEHCRTRLSKFRVPGSVEFRDEFPRTSIGKTRKVELKAEALAAQQKQAKGQ
jgi:crotonobetaine/carnitine-CoA ligase